MDKIEYTNQMGDSVFVNVADNHPAVEADKLDRAQRVYKDAIELASQDRQTVWRLVVDNDGALLAINTVASGRPVSYSTATKVDISALA